MPGRGARREPRPQVHLPRPADPLRPLFPARAGPPHRAAADVLHARGDGARAERAGGPARSARDRVLQRALQLRFHELDADAVQFGHAPLAARELLPHHGLRRSRRHLRGDQGKRDAAEIRRRHRQRLDAGARAGRPHQGHQRQEPGRGAVPEGGERHRGRGQPGRQAQGRGVLVPRDLAPRHRGIPGAAQEHRRRPPPHPRHEHRQLGAGSLHEARDGERRVDAVLALRRARPAREVRQGVREGLPRVRGEVRARRAEALQEDSRGAAVAQDADDAVRDRASVAHVQGSVQPALAAAARGRRAQLQPVHRDHAEHRARRDRRVQPGLGQHAGAPRRRDRPHGHGEAEAHGRHRDAHARQRHRSQLLQRQQGAQLQLQAPPGGPRHHGLPGLPAHAAHPVRLAGGGGVRRPLDGADRLQRVLGLDRSRRGARAVLDVQGLAVGPRASCRSTR